MGEKSVQELDFFLLFQDDPEGGTWDNNHLVTAKTFWQMFINFDLYASAILLGNL